MTKSIIFIYSYHHMNTQKIGIAIGGKINAEITEINEINEQKTFEGYNLIGFGAGIDSGKHYPQMLKFAENLPNVNNKKAFIFSTSGIYSDKKMLKDHRALRTILEGKGFKVIGEFGCNGYNTNSILKYFGGMNKGSPNNEDILNAEIFGESLLKK